MQHTFRVLEAPVAGYHCVLGQDFRQANSACMQFISDKLELSFSSGGVSTSLCRPLSTSQAVSGTRDVCALVVS